MKPAELVRDAWDFDHIRQLQERYIEVYEENLNRLTKASFDAESVMRLLYEEAEAYVQCMRSDPLLPNKLLPEGYLGQQVYSLHGNLRKSIAARLLSDPV